MAGNKKSGEKQTARNGATLGFEEKLWQAADKLRSNMDAAEEDSEPFEEKMKRLTATLRAQMEEGKKLDAAIWNNLKRLGFGK